MLLTGIGRVSSGEHRLEPESVEILGCIVSNVTIHQTLSYIEQWIRGPSERPHFVVATGFHGIWEAYKNPRLREVLNSADLFCPDGVAPVFLSWLRGVPIRERVPGPDLLALFSERASEAGYRSFLYGDTEETLRALTTQLQHKSSRHRIVGAVAPPFRELKVDEELAIVNEINRALPDVLWVGLGFPKQEWWIYRNLSELRVPVVIGVGAAFRLVSGKVRRAPQWIGRLGFEWLWRLAMEPAKLWRRDLIDGPRFLYHALGETAALRLYRGGRRRMKRNLFPASRK